VINAIDRAAQADVRHTTCGMSVIGVAWSPIRAGKLGDGEYSIVFSVEGPPFVDVIQGPAGSPRDATEGSRFDHIGYWAKDLKTDKQEPAARGAPLEFDSSAGPVCEEHVACRRPDSPRHERHPRRLGELPRRTGSRARASAVDGTLDLGGA